MLKHWHIIYSQMKIQHVYNYKLIQSSKFITSALLPQHWIYTDWQVLFHKKIATMLKYNETSSQILMYIFIVIKNYNFY